MYGTHQQANLTSFFRVGGTISNDILSSPLLHHNYNKASNESHLNVSLIILRGGVTRLCP